MKLRYILVASVAALVFGVFAIGQNAGNAQDQAAKIATLDNSNQPTDQALAALANYVHGHMGASITVFLGTSYQHAVAAANASPNTSGQVYHDAQVACTSHTSAVNQANCVQAYVNAHATPGETNLQPAQVDKAPYTHAYVAPHWTPDLAGWLIAAGLLGLIVSGLSLVRKNA